MSMTEPGRKRIHPTSTLTAILPRRFAIVCGVALACAFAIAMSATALATTYKYHEHITGFIAPSGIANCGGDVYVSDTELGVVDEYNSAGAYVGKITGAAAGGFVPAAVAVNCSGGDIYVDDIEGGVVDEFSDNFAAAEKYIGQITGAAAGSSFDHLQGVGINNSRGIIYVVNDVISGKNSVTTIDEFSDDFAAAEKYLGQITGHGAEKFGSVSAVAVSPANNLYVANFGKNAVEEFTEPGSSPSSEPGTFVGQVTGLDTKAKSLKPNLGLAFDGGENVLVVDYPHKVIDVFKPTFGSGETVVGEITGEEVENPNSENTGFGTLAGLAFDSSNNSVYVADDTNEDVDVFSPEIQPTYKTCAKVSKVDDKYAGKFLDKYCKDPATKAQEEEGKVNKYELTSAALPSTFTGKSTTTVLDFYEGATLKYKVECKKDASKGEITGESAGSEVITYSKCKGKEEPSGTAVACENTAKETIASASLASQLVDEGGKVYDRLTGKGSGFAEFKCGSTDTFKVSGSVLGEIGAEQVNAASKSETITFSPAEHGLTAELNGKPGYTGGVEGTEGQKGAMLYIELP